jgi:hypothetical protein
MVAMVTTFFTFVVSRYARQIDFPVYGATISPSREVFRPERSFDFAVAFETPRMVLSIFTPSMPHGAAWTDLIHRLRPRRDRRWDHSE